MKKFSFINNVKLNKAPKKMFLLKQISLLMATAFILVFAVFAWFTGDDNDVKATGIHVTMEGNNNLLISLNGGKDFLGGIDLMNDEHQKFISSDNLIKGILNMRDITSDGKTFYRPVFEDDNSNTNRVPDTDQTWDLAGDTSYISETVVFRTSVPSDIYLSENTLFSTSAEDENKLLSNNDPVGIGNKSSFGNFSNDCIVGALRLSVINSNNELLYVHIPRKDIEMTKTITDGVTSYDVTTGIENVSKNTSVHTYYKATGSTSAPYYSLVESKLVLNELLSSSHCIATTTQQENGFYEATVTINIWLEGCDPETTRALSKGQYSISLDFTATEVN